MFSRLFCIRKEKRTRKKNTHKPLTNGLEVFKTVENPYFNNLLKDTLNNF